MADAAEYALILPCRAESVALARLYIATILRTHLYGEAEVGDAKLAVSELVSASIETGGTEDITVAAHCGPASCRIAISPVPEQAPADAPERIDIVKALFDSLDFDHDAAWFLVAQTSQ